jgi:hypothetical protein
MTAKEILSKIKAVFDAPPVETPTTQQTISAYLIDGSGPIYVDNSDDGIADIDSNDKVYSDAALTTPYPDGTYNVTGTTFGFTIAGGIVTAVNDVAGTGPGTPVDPATLAKPTPPPAPAPTPPTPVTLTAEAVAAMYAKFATGTPEERLANLETMIKALMECNFGYQIRQGQEDQAIQVYKNSLAPVQAAVATAKTQMEAANKKIDDQEKAITKQNEVIKGMFEFMEALAKEPVAEPKTISPQKKEKFEKAAKTESRFERMAALLKENAKEKNAEPV